MRSSESSGGETLSKHPVTSAVALIRSTAALLLLALATAQVSASTEAAGSKEAPREQLSVGYSLLYQEAEGIPKLKWLVMFKQRTHEMGRLTDDLAGYYRQLADTMQKLSKENPAMRIDVEPLPRIEAEARKAIGKDLAKQLAPLVGKQGTEFERTALLMFFNSLDEQRHLVGVMMEQETDPSLKKFLRTTSAQLEAHYTRIGALLDRRYFKH